MSNPNTPSSDWAANLTRNTVRLAFWTAAWVLTMAVAAFGQRFIWHSNDWLTILAIAINALIGFGMIAANKRHLKGLDEMQQKIQLEAMGLTLGVGLVLGLAYSNLDHTNIIANDAEISHLVMLMGLTYIGAVFVGLRRYR